MSELYGRKNPLLISSLGFSIFSVAVAVAKDVQTVFICRFFAGRHRLFDTTSPHKVLN